MTETFEYFKKRGEFGLQPQFADRETSILGSFDPVPNLMQQKYIMKNPTDIVLGSIPEKSGHKINTDRVEMDTRKMKHIEGGWPENIDYTEPQDTKKYKKKIEKDNPDFNEIILQLAEHTRIACEQNKQIDMYEEYFENKEPEVRTESASTKTLMMFKDKSGLNRAVSSISWNPEYSNKIAVAYARRNPSKIDSSCLDSYIWDLNSPNEPDRVLSPPSPMLCLAYNHKSSDLLAGGCFNGVVAVWDYKNQKRVMDTSEVEKSHHYSVVDLFWLHGKAGAEFVTTSSDGRMLWWDARGLSKGPVQEVVLGEEGKAYGGTKIEFNFDAPNKFLCGTDIGIILLINKKVQAQTKASDLIKFGLDSGKHHGPLMAVKRNPFSSKYFLTVGDWSAKVWSEDLKIPLITTKYNDVLLTDGNWSPSKPGLFFLTRSDGWLDAWDYYYRQNEPAFSQKVSDNYLTTLCVKPLQNSQNPNESNLISVGDSEGIVNMMELSDSLCCYNSNTQKKEKDSLMMIFDREFRREKNLETAKKLSEVKKAAVKKEPKESNKEENVRVKVDDYEKKFLQFVEEMQTEGTKSPEPSKEHPIDSKKPKEEKEQEPAKEQEIEQPKSPVKPEEPSNAESKIDQPGEPQNIASEEQKEEAKGESPKPQNEENQENNQENQENQENPENNENPEGNGEKPEGENNENPDKQENQEENKEGEAENKGDEEKKEEEPGNAQPEQEADPQTASPNLESPNLESSKADSPKLESKKVESPTKPEDNKEEKKE